MHPSSHGHLGCSHILAIVSKVTVNMVYRYLFGSLFYLFFVCVFLTCLGEESMEKREAEGEGKGKGVGMLLGGRAPRDPVFNSPGYIVRSGIAESCM